MSDENSMLQMSRKGRLTADITYLMLKGAGYAALFVLVIWFGIAVIAGIGRLLPEESRQAPDPSPWSALETPAPLTELA